MKILVTGGLGYLGSKVVDYLLHKGHRVKVIDRGLYAEAAKITSKFFHETYGPENYVHIYRDIRDMSIMSSWIKGCDAVIHLASLVGDPSCSIDPSKTYEVNFLATKTIAELCKFHKVDRMIFASTCSVYGYNKFDNSYIRENSDKFPLSLYARTKLDAENMLQKMETDNFHPTILRMGTLHGLSRRMRFDLVVNLLTAQAYHEKKINVFGGGQWRAFCSVADAARAYVKCLELPAWQVNRPLNVVTENMTIGNLGELIAKKIPGVEPEYIDVKDYRDYRVSTDTMFKLLQIQPEFKIKTNIDVLHTLCKQGNFEDFRAKEYNNAKTTKEWLC